jgi:hypothetical protein
VQIISETHFGASAFDQATSFASALQESASSAFASSTFFAASLGARSAPLLTACFSRQARALTDALRVLGSRHSVYIHAAGSAHSRSSCVCVGAAGEAIPLAVTVSVVGVYAPPPSPPPSPPPPPPPPPLPPPSPPPPPPPPPPTTVVPIIPVSNRPPIVVGAPMPPPPAPLVVIEELDYEPEELSDVPEVPADTVAPVLVLVGPAVVQVMQLQVYVDQGAVADDNVDGFLPVTATGPTGAHPLHARLAHDPEPKSRAYPIPWS